MWRKEPIISSVQNGRLSKPGEIQESVLKEVKLIE